jgi:hypothetical protein
LTVCAGADATLAELSWRLAIVKVRKPGRQDPGVNTRVLLISRRVERHLPASRVKLPLKFQA